MSWVGRFTNLFRKDRLDRELEEELALHLEEAAEHGRSAEEVRRAFGATLRHREASRDIKLLPWLDALTSDVVFGWRQLHKHRSATAAAILSLGLAIGATTAAFRLVDAVLLRPLPVSHPENLYHVVQTHVNTFGRLEYWDDSDYPTFRDFRDAVSGKADLILAGGSYRQDTLIGVGDEVERPYREFVSGNYFGSLGIQPALGRLLTPQDDVTPGGHPVAVIGYEFWSRRFGRDPKVIGNSFRMSGLRYEIVGVSAKGFTGTEPGAINDIFIPAAMNAPALNERGWSWFRILMRPRPGTSVEQVRQPLQAAFSRDLEDRAKDFPKDMTKQDRENWLKQTVLIQPAASGASDLQKDYRRPLAILSILVLLVLLVACANVGNLLSAQAAARAREMALRVSIGAGRGRLIQMVLVESALLAAFASMLGALVSWWTAPVVVSMLAPPSNPVRLVLEADWRAIGFGVALTLAVALLFGILPALRASAVQPMSALRGGQEAGARRGLMHSLIGLQVAFCVLVMFVAGLFVATLSQLSNRPLGFAHRNVAAVHVAAAGERATVPLQRWMQVADRLGQLPGVESVAFATWPLLGGNRWTMGVHVAGHDHEMPPAYCLAVSPGFFSTMRIPLLAGREFRPGDAQPHFQGADEPVPGVAIVNQAFANAYFDGQNPVGRTFTILGRRDRSIQVEIVGQVRNTAYYDIRESMHPIAFLPVKPEGGMAMLVRTAGDSLANAAQFRREIPLAGPGLAVRNIEVQSALVESQMLRERLLATLSLFFAIVALALAGIGLYGVLNYSALRQRREIGIRMALGARPAHVVRRVTTGMLLTVLMGSAAGVAGGLACGRFVKSLLFGVQADSLGMIAIPVLALLVAAIAAAVPPAVRSVRVDPAQVLRD
jgi:predicted permease